MTCTGCGRALADGLKFCIHCGTRVGLSCPACGTPAPPDARFCGECGTALTATAVPAQMTAAHAEAAVPTAERRLVSVLFADLVGFTTLSETRDAEEVRELLTRYFDTCTTIITRYGGTVEKFIGDAVMAVWGAPVANEDDAERSVRAALEIVAAVKALGEDIGVSELNARGGVLTGEAAVTLGASGQGLVAGDLVNTASRIQSVAAPGTVLVGETTRFATQAAVGYEDAGLHTVKGKTEPLALHRALRVVSMRSGGQRAAGLEAPFVGRAREMTLVRDLMHASADGPAAHHVSITGIAGIGKSRLSWELEKYVDGLVEQFWWHRGRCLAYGEGVTFSALAEMIRSRALIVDGEDAESARAKLASTVAQHLPDIEERRWVEPRLRQLLALDEESPGAHEDLFPAWRLFFERMADTSPVVLVFEDMHWADSSLLDFIDYLLEWSRSHRLFVLTLGRPELLERRPGWGATRRNASSLYLEALPDDAMQQLLDGMVPGLPERVSRTVRDRAGGVPLYAVETVRMMLDQGLLEKVGEDYRPAAPIDDLKVPDTLHSLVAARLDALEPPARSLLADAAVLGKSFSEDALCAVSGAGAGTVTDVLDGLIRRDILERSTDPRSPERGQLQFVQDLVQLVAYETLSRSDRRDKHSAVAGYLENAGRADGEGVAVVAAHYLEALSLTPDGAAASELRAKTRLMLLRAGDRAAGLGAAADGAAFYSQAAEHSATPQDAAEAHERAGRASLQAARAPEARQHFDEAIAAYDAAGLPAAAARANAQLGEVDLADSHLTKAIERMQGALGLLPSGTPDPDIAALAAQLARALSFAGRSAEAADYVEQSLTAAEALGRTDTMAQALNTKALLLSIDGRYVEADAILRRALEVALAGNHHVAAFRTYLNLAVELDWAQRFAEEEELLHEGLELAHRVGDRLWEHFLTLTMLMPLTATGRWDEALAIIEPIAASDDGDALGRSEQYLALVVPILVARGDSSGAQRMFSKMSADNTDRDQQMELAFQLCHAHVLSADGNAVEALAAARRAAEPTHPFGPRSSFTTAGSVAAAEAAFALGDQSEMQTELDRMRSMLPGHRCPLIDAHQTRFEARWAALSGGEPAGLTDAAEAFRALGMPFETAVVLLEHAEWLISENRARDGEPLLAEAQQTFTQLKATPWLSRVDSLLAQPAAVVAT
jgi:class 3 adenylate cyclase/tetratricopeptide (TPR) repeat protein